MRDTTHDLRQRTVRALSACDAQWNDDTGDHDTPASEYLADMADAALAVLHLELQRKDDLVAELRKQVASRDKAIKRQKRHYAKQRDGDVAASPDTMRGSRHA